MADLTIYEVSSCSTCRKLASLLHERGVEYHGIEYHDVGLGEEEIRELARKSGLRPRDLLRLREPLVDELGLRDGDGVSDDELVALMASHPKLLQRPIAVRGERAVLARPVERVLELLD
ncbi:MAG TPA: ArsC/Spx/MgsR family protein [Solirubrobacteraceae bacterium]|nr:ArsC/Spx/MgsR family protein [Solirubrobacteraceae bacterium]